VSAVALSPRQRRRDAVFTITGESTHLMSERRQFRDGVRATQEEEPEADPKADKGAKKDDKGKGKGKKDEPEEEELPLLQEKRDLTTKMFQTTEHYATEWEDFNEEDNFAQKHDVELVKNEIRDGVKLQIRDEVDEMFRDQLKKLKQELGQNFAKPPKAKKIKPSKKNAKGEKIKFKKLTGDKNKEIAGLSVEETLVKLVDHGLVNSYKPRKISDLVGDFNYLGTVRASCEPPQGEEWQPADPSMQQLRAAITEYCILPLGSQRVATAMRGDQHGDVPDSSYEPVRSILLYGPKGSGKTAMVEAIAHELGALLINISPAKVKGKFGENKKAPAILPHLICKVATDPAFSPVIVYMDDAHEYMVGKKFDKQGPGRFCKEFQNYKKSFFTRKKNGGFFTASVKKGPQPCPPDDKNCPNGTFDARILFIGCTSQPELADPKQTKLFFDKMLYFPYPDHASRYMLWKQTIAEQLKGSPVNSVGDLSTLAHVSEGFSAGAIIQCVKKTLTKRRVERLNKRPFESSEFLNPLARAAAEKQLSYQDDHKAFLKFTSEVASTLATEKKNLEIIKAGGDPNAKKKGKKK
jgi:hypothetical protein